MFDPETLPVIRQAIRDQTAAERYLLEEVLADVRSMRSAVRTIHPRGTTSIALVASDGGNNRVDFNPFSVQLVRVVDSYGEEKFRDVVTPSTDITQLSQRHLDDEESPLGRLMRDLKVSSLSALSPMIPTPPRSGGWTVVYRDLCEWAIIYNLIVNTTFSTDTLIVKDGLLRAKIFARTLFVDMYRLMANRIAEILRQNRRKVYLVGIAKKSSVMQRYALAMAIEGLFDPGNPRYVAIPHTLQEKVYRWDEYIRGADEQDEAGEASKFNVGSMHFARFGSASGDPVWTVDLLESQASQAQEIFGCLLADAIEGFPVPFYPNCLQQADHHAQVADFDLEVIRDTLVDAVRALVVDDRRPVFDALQLSTKDISQRRYG